MTLIDGDRIITAQLYDDQYEEFTEKKMSIIDYVNAYTDEGVTTADDVLDKIRAEIIDTLYVDSLIFGELIDFKNGKISADDVIEEFNRVTRLEVLKIFDEYKSESEG